MFVLSRVREGNLIGKEKKGMLPGVEMDNPRYFFLITF